MEGLCTANCMILLDNVNKLTPISSKLKNTIVNLFQELLEVDQWLYTKNKNGR
jgi:hypothetical protein